MHTTLGARRSFVLTLGLLTATAALTIDPNNSDAKGLMESMAKWQWVEESTGEKATGHARGH